MCALTRRALVLTQSTQPVDTSGQLMGVLKFPGDGQTPLERCVGSPAALKIIFGRSRVVSSCCEPSARSIILP
jgi:hypothetical protein